MFCETCGKKLIRGYSFCVDCGTPVPAGVWDEQEETPVDPNFQLSADNSDSMPGIGSVGSASVEGGSLSSGSAVPMFNTDSGLGGIGGFSSDDQAVVNLFGSSSVAVGGINNNLFSVPSANIDMPSIEAPAKTSQAKQREPEKGEERMLNDFSMSEDVGDDTLEITDNKVNILSGMTMDDEGAEIDLSPYKFLDNQIDISVPEEEQPAEETAVEEPVETAEPIEPVAEEPAEPVAVAVAVEEEPIVVEEPVAEPIEEIAEVTEVTEVAQTAEEPAEAEPVEEEPVEVEPVAIADEEAEEPIEVEPVDVNEVTEVAEPVEEAAEEPVEVEPVAVAEEPTEVEPVEEPVDNAAEKTAIFTSVSDEEPEAAAVAATAAAVEDLDDFVPEEMSVIEESSPIAEEVPEIKIEETPKQAEEKPKAEQKVMPEPMTAKSQPKSAPTAPAASATATTAAAVAAPVARPVQGVNNVNNANRANGAKVIYCRNCGQDMAEGQTVCKNCGAPYKGAYVPPNSAKPKEKKLVFGVLPVSAIVTMASIFVVMGALIIFLATRSGGNSSVPVSGDLSVDTPTSTSTSSSTTTSSSASTSEEPVESTSSTSSDTSEPDTSSSETSSSSSSSSSNSSNSSSSSSASASSSSSKPQSSSSKPQSSSSKPQSSSSSTPSNPTTMTAAAASQELSRLMLVDTAVTIYGEIGKINTYAMMTLAAQDDGVEIPSTLAFKMKNNIEAGNKTVAQSLQTIASVNSAFVPFKNSVDSLYAKYQEYYNYVTKTSDLSRSVCGTYYLACEQAMENANSNQFTSSYTANDKVLARKSMTNNALGMVNVIYESFYNLRSTFGTTSLNYAESGYNTLAANADTFASAVASAYQVKGYSVLMNGDSTLQYNFSKLDKIIKVYVNLCDYVGKFEDYFVSAY